MMDLSSTGCHFKTKARLALILFISNNNNTLLAVLYHRSNLKLIYYSH